MGKPHKNGTKGPGNPNFDAPGWALDEEKKGLALITGLSFFLTSGAIFRYLIASTVMDAGIVSGRRATSRV
jgi:hypothetical protein